MIRNYLKTALRNIKRHRFLSTINIFGLAVSMALSMTIIMLVADQLMYDRHNTKSERIFRINSLPLGPQGQVLSETASTSLPVKQELTESYTGIKSAVRFVRGFGNPWLEFEGNNVNIPISGYYADPEVFDVFEYEFEYGVPYNALVEPYSVVLTKAASRKLFRKENPAWSAFLD